MDRAREGNKEERLTWQLQKQEGWLVIETMASS